MQQLLINNRNLLGKSKMCTNRTTEGNK